VLAQHYGLPADLGRSVCSNLFDVRNHLEIGRQAFGEPCQLAIALGLAIKPPARINTIEVTVSVEIDSTARW